MTVRGAPGAPQRAGRPRDPSLDRAILDAAIQLLAEDGFEGMSIEAVAHRAGVGKPTIYRRWPSKQAMVIDALEGLSDRIEVPADGTVRQRLSGFMERWWQLVGRAEGTRRTRLFSCLIGEIGRSPELGEAVRRTFVAARRRKIGDLLREGIETGELRPDTDVELATDLLFSPLLARRIVTGGRITGAVGRTVVDVVFDGCGTGS